MILADENIDDQITETIRAMGIEVYSIAETHSGIKDEEIIERQSIHRESFSQKPP